jgi:hypothetical protein
LLPAVVVVAMAQMVAMGLVAVGLVGYWRVPLL